MNKILLLLILVACSDQDRTREVLLDQGFTNISVGGHSFFGCSDDDAYCTSFEATGPTGRQVSGAVGCGHFGGKGCTVRVSR